MQPSEIGLLGTLIEAVPLPAYVCEAPDGAIVHYNQAAVRLWGRAPAAGERFCGSWRLYRPDGTVLPHAETPMARALREGVSTDGEEVMIERPDGTRLTALAQVAPLRDATGRVLGAINVLLDVTDRPQAGLTATRLAAIVESSDDAIISKDLNGNIQSWNAGAQRIFGYTAAEAIGQPVSMLIPPQNADEEPAILRRIGQGERIDNYETVRMRKDGRRITISLTVSPIRDARGVIVGASKIARDITAQKNAEAEREGLLVAEQAARAEAEAANRAKDQFLAMLAHELRNPLGAITTALRVIAVRPSDTTRLDKAMDIATRQSRHLARLLDDLIDLSRVVQGKVEFRKTIVDLRAAVQHVVEANRASIEDRRHTLTVRLPDEPLGLDADSTRLEQVIGNLLHNATKYTPPGGHIEVTVEQESGLAILRVKDNGIGIDPHLLPRVFDLFAQGETSLAHSQGGLGIGLTLVRNLVEAHGGRVEARSEGHGQGSEFIVRLPLAAAVTGTEARAAARAHGGPLRVLLVEDNADAREVLRVELELLGHTVEVAEDGPGGVIAAIRTRPAVVIIDLGLPGFDGFEVARRIRAALGRAVRLIALSGYSKEQHQAQATAAGFDAYLVKPLRPEDLAHLVPV